MDFLSKEEGFSNPSLHCCIALLIDVRIVPIINQSTLFEQTKKVNDLCEHGTTPKESNQI